MKRVGDAYKSARKQRNFVIDLMKLDIPKLLLVESYKPDDPNVEQMFIDMIRTFVQRNALRDILMGQITTIMVNGIIVCKLKALHYNSTTNVRK